VQVLEYLILSWLVWRVLRDMVRTAAQH